MTRIRLYEHPLDQQQECKNFESDSIGQWLLDHYGDAPHVSVAVFAGEPSGAADVTGNVAALLRNDKPEYVVLQSPGSDPYTWLQVIIVVFSVVSTLMASPPTMPNNVNRTQQSPNNALGARENQARVQQRVEDIFGTVLSVPSMMMPTYYVYIKNVKYEIGYYCISRGYIDATEICDGQTPLDVITGSSASVYWPFTSPNSGSPVIQIGAPIEDPIVGVDRSNEIDGPTLKPLNELQLTPGATFTFSSLGGVQRITQSQKAPNVNSLFNPGDQITVSAAPFVESFSIPATASASGFAGAFSYDVDVGDGGHTTVNRLAEFRVGDSISVVSAGVPSATGTYTITSLDSSFLGVSPPPPASAEASTAFAVTRDYSATYDITGVADGFLEVTGGSGFPVSSTMPATITLVALTPVSEYTDWVTLTAPNRTGVWINIVADNGLLADSGTDQNAVTVEFELSIEKLDPGSLEPTGIVEIVVDSVVGSVTDEIAKTIRHTTAWVGPARARMRRTSQHDFNFAGRVTDEIKWADLYSVTPVPNAHFGNKTTIHTVTAATSRSTAAKTRQLNCIASRLLPTYVGRVPSGAFADDGRHVSGSISATSKLVDIIAAVAIDKKIGNRDLDTDLDIEQIYGVQQQLDAWHPEAGQFNFTLDTTNTSFEETVQMIANAGFCSAYRQSGKIRLAFDRAQDLSVALFSHRNKKPKAETITRTFAAEGDTDGVEFAYVDPDTNTTETIRIPTDGSASYPKKFEIPGIRSFAQAWFRANREYWKIRGQRISIETSTTLDARALLPNSRIDIVDNTRFKSYDGEVVGQTGLMLTLSDAVVFEAAEPHSIVLMRRDGSVQSIPVRPGPSSRQVLLNYAPTEAVVSEFGNDGIRTIYSFASDSKRRAMAYLVQEINLSDPQYPVIKAVNYSDSYYQADTAAVPAKGAIIGLAPA